MYQQAPQYAGNQPGYGQPSYGQPTPGHPEYQQAYPQGPAFPSEPAVYQQPAADPMAVVDPYGLDNKLSENARLPFIRKVLGILALQFALTAAGVTVAVSDRAASLPFFRQHPELMVIALVGYIVTLYALGCYKSVARNVPTNYIMLFIFTSCMTYMVSNVTCYYEPQVVLAAAVLTAATVGALAIYAITTKTDFTYCGGAVWAFFFIILTCTLLAVVLDHTYQSRIFLSGLIIFICCFYIIYDVQLLVGNKDNALSIDDYVFAAMMIYIDIMRLFLEILKVLEIGRAHV